MSKGLPELYVADSEDRASGCPCTRDLMRTQMDMKNILVLNYLFMYKEEEEREDEEEEEGEREKEEGQEEEKKKVKDKD